MEVTLEQAIEIIKRGEIVAIPTETVYGLAADAKNAIAVLKTFEKKGRPADNPLIVHISELDQLTDLASDIPDEVYTLANRFWPGPLTIVLKRDQAVLDVITAALDTVAVRMPDHPLTLELIHSTGPVTAPSANKSGKPSPTKPAHLEQDYGSDLPYLDGGECSIGIESTVLDLTQKPFSVLRPGAISSDEISAALGVEIIETENKSSQTKRSPGTRYTHYKPEAEVHWMKSLIIDHFETDTLYVYHSGNNITSSENVIDFNGNMDKLAQSLYDIYRTADLKNYIKILVEPIQQTSKSGIERALFNRIQLSVKQ